MLVDLPRTIGNPIIFRDLQPGLDTRSEEHRMIRVSYRACSYKRALPVQGKADAGGYQACGRSGYGCLMSVNPFFVLEWQWHASLPHAGRP